MHNNIRTSQPRPHLTSPIIDAFRGEEMLQYLELPDSEPMSTMSPQAMHDQYFGEIEHSPHLPYQPAGSLLFNNCGDYGSTTNLAIDPNFLSAYPYDNGGYRSPTSPSIASSRGSSPYPSSRGSQSPFSQTAPLMNVSPMAMTSTSYENLPNNMSLLNYRDSGGSLSDPQLTGTHRSFYGEDPIATSYHPSSSSLPLPGLPPRPPSPTEPPGLVRRDTLVTEAFDTMEKLAKDMELYKKTILPKPMRDNMRTSFLDDLRRRMPEYTSTIDEAASKAIGTMANREASQRRKKKKGHQHFCLLCREGRDFTTKDNFLTHIRIHFGVKLSECNICKHSFANKTVPKRHRTTCEQNRRNGNHQLPL